MMKRAASTAVQKEEVSGFNSESSSLDSLLREALKDPEVLSSDDTAKVFFHFILFFLLFLFVLSFISFISFASSLIFRFRFHFFISLILIKMLARAKTAPLSQFLSGSRKNMSRREKGVFSDGELREWYYKKKF